MALHDEMHVDVAPRLPGRVGLRRRGERVLLPDRDGHLPPRRRARAHVSTLGGQCGGVSLAVSCGIRLFCRRPLLSLLPLLLFGGVMTSRSRLAVVVVVVVVVVPGRHGHALLAQLQLHDGPAAAPDVARVLELDLQVQAAAGAGVGAPAVQVGDLGDARGLDPVLARVGAAGPGAEGVAALAEAVALLDQVGVLGREEGLEGGEEGGGV